MGIRTRLLSPGEQELRHFRRHVMVLFAPVLVLLACVAAVWAAWAFVPAAYQPYAWWVVGALAIVVVAAWVVRPFLVWLTTTYTVTDARVMTRSGILAKAGHDLPLNRIADVTYHSGLVDRMLGCGTLVFTTAADDPLTLDHVPRVEQVYGLVTQQMLKQPPARPGSPANP